MITIMFGLIEILDGLPHQIMALKAGETLFHLGDRVSQLYVVRAGDVHLLRYDAEGREAVMQRAGPETLLAESSIFSEVYHCNAVAAAPSELAVIARADFRRAADADPRTMEAIARHLAREVQRARARLEILSKKTVRERLDTWSTLGGGELQRGSMVAVAREIGVTPEALYRELNKHRR